MIGTSGTILSLGTVATAIDRGSRAGGNPQSARECEEHPASAQARDRARTSTQRLKLPGLDPRRADITVAGAVLLDTLLRKLDAERDHAVRPGAARRAGARLHPAASQGNRARRSLSGRAAPFDDRARRALQLGGGTLAAGGAAGADAVRPDARASTGSATASANGWSLASLLHDIGMHISYERHHRHSYYLIKNGDLRGFEPEEIEVIALLTRYHRRGDARPATRGLPRSLERAAPDRPRARVVPAAGRNARSQPQRRRANARRPRARQGACCCRCAALGDSELEVWAANKQLSALDHALKRSSGSSHTISRSPMCPRAGPSAGQSGRARRPSRARASRPRRSRPPPCSTSRGTEVPRDVTV